MDGGGNSLRRADVLACSARFSSSPDASGGSIHASGSFGGESCSTISHSRSAVPPAANQSVMSSLACISGQNVARSSTRRRRATPCRLAATSMTCSRPGSSLSPQMTTSAPFSVWLNSGPPLAGAHRVAGRCDAVLTQRDDVFLAFDHEDGATCGQLLDQLVQAKQDNPHAPDRPLFLIRSLTLAECFR